MKVSVLEWGPDGQPTRMLFEEPAGVTAEHLRNVRIVALVNAHRASVDPGPPVIRRRRRPLPDEFFREVARAYAFAVAWQERSPLAYLSRVTGAPHGTVSRWAAEAARRGFLPAGSQGRVRV